LAKLIITNLEAASLIMKAFFGDVKEIFDVDGTKDDDDESSRGPDNSVTKFNIITFDYVDKNKLP